MERVGIRVDAERLAEIGQGMAERIEQLQAEIHELAGREFTIGSPQQLAEVLFNELGLTKKRRGKTGFSTDARVLGQIRDEHEIVAKVESWRELTKLKNTYLDALPELIDPRTGASTRPSTRSPTTTGRLSSTNPNLQNIPIRSEIGRPIRSCFVAERGQAAALLRLQPGRAAGARPRRRRGGPARDLRLRRGRARRDRRRGPRRRARTRSAPAERSKAKMVNYGIAYGLSDFGLADRLQISREEAGAYIDRYFERFPAVKRFIDETIERADRRGLRDDADGPPPQHPRAALGPAPAPPARRAARGQHRDPGHRRRHHQAGDGPLPPRARRRGARDAARPPDPRRAPLRGAGGGDGARPRS